MPSTSSVPASPVARSWGDELRAMLHLAWPLVVAQLAQSALHTTDVVLLGRLGPHYLAAGSLAVNFLLPFLIAGMGVVAAVSPLVAQARGARRFGTIRPIVRQGLWVAITLGMLILPIVLPVESIFVWMGQDPQLAAMAGEFMMIAAWSLFPALGIAALRSLVSAFAATRAILAITIAGVTVNACVASVLIFGHFGLPRLELRGAAISTLTTNIAMFLLFLLYVRRQRRFRRFHILHRFWQPDWSRYREIFRIGLPIGITLLAEAGLFSAATLMMGWLGTDEVAAHAIALQCASMAFMVPAGIGVAATVRVGLAFGRRDREGIRKAGWTALLAGAAFTTCSCVLFLTAAPWLVSLFLDPVADANAARLAAGFLIVAGVFQLVDGGQVVAANALRGLSDTTVPMIIALCGYWLLGLPVAYGLGFIAGWRGTGIWIGLAAGLAAVACVLVARFAMRDRLGLTARVPR